MQYYLESAQRVFEEVKSSPEGISSEEAASRLKVYGKNRLEEKKGDSLFKRFLKQLADPMIIILICAAAISAVLDVLAREIPYDTFIILFVVLANAILGVVQESKAEAAIAALQEMSAAMSKVLRDGRLITVKSEELVPGDVVVLEAGDAVPADCRIFECASLQIEEAPLTGESVPVHKIIDVLNGDSDHGVPLGDRKNMAYMGSTVVYGRGHAVVVGTGMNTEMGKIAHAISQAEEGLTPLQQKLASLSKILSVLVIFICLFIFGFNIVEALIRNEPVTLNLALASFMTAVSLAVAAIPEGLVAVVTIVLSMGVTNMSKKNAIIRKLTAVETLGCAQVICSDKTGTLTQNKMTVVDHFGEDEQGLARGMALCCDAEVDENGNVTGEPTEAALVSYAYKLSLNKNDLKVSYPRVGEAPFDSLRKMMSTVHKDGDGFVQYTKGAPDEVLKNCSFYFDKGEIKPLTDEVRADILSHNKEMADRALRVLACACRRYETLPESFEPESLETQLVFMGLTGMIDPVRDEVKDAIDQCRDAGIIPVMITGDHHDTAVAIAKELGIITDESQAITGAELSRISDEDFKERVRNIFVYARVQPEHKTRIVSAWQSLGYVTAMTGDGVNDAPSIKTADIGVGMGITGTDVTKNVADMVLADDNFATIVGAVSEGRRIYDNIRKAIQFLLGSNLSEVLAVFFASLCGFTVLRPTHLLFINLVTDCFPALALGVEKPEKGIMKRKPRKSTDGVFADGLGIDVLYEGVTVAILTLIAYFIGRGFDPSPVTENGMLISGYGMTMAFLTMSLCEIFHSFNMRSRHASLFSIRHQNLPLFCATAGALILTAVIIEVPVLAKMFGFVHLDLSHYLISVGIAVCIIPIVEIVKLIRRLVTKE